MDYSNIHILIVDDDPTTRRIMTRLIKQIGFTEFSVAENGRQAFEMLKKSDYGLILSDWGMPDSDGLALL